MPVKTGTTKPGERKWNRSLRFIPVLGTARHYLALSRLAAALEALISAGVNIFEAWDLAAAASGSPALRRAVADWRPKITAGQMPSEAVRACRLFPEMFANFYASGEISGKLDESLRICTGFTVRKACANSISFRTMGATLHLFHGGAFCRLHRDPVLDELFQSDQSTERLLVPLCAPGFHALTSLHDVDRIARQRRTAPA